MPDRIFIELVLGVCQKGREGSRETFKCCDVCGNHDDYSFDLYLSRSAERVCSCSLIPRIHTQYIYTH